MNGLEIRDAAFSYGDQAVFHGVDLTVNPGEVVCLMGMNGCGKSTLLDCVLGEKQLREGEILVGGQPEARYRPAALARGVAFVPQNHRSSFPYTVEQVVLMGRTARAGGFLGPGREDRELVRRALERVGIAGLGQRPYTQLSGGELQLVVLARALVQDTPILLMDEPTAHLDFRNELLFLETVVELARERELAVLLATHAPNQAFYLESQGLNVRVAAMFNRTIGLSGRPEEVLTPENVARIYHIRAVCLEGETGDRSVRQLVPIHTRP